MAKLSAYGRKELARFVKDLPLNNDADVTERRKFIAIMDNRDVMKKDQVRFAPDQYRPNGELHDWGWHKIGKIKAELPLESAIDAYTEKFGYTRIFV